MKDDPKTGRSVQVWEVDGGKELFTALASSGTAAVQAVAFSADGKLLALSGGDGPVDVWDVPAKKHKLTVLGRTRQGMQLGILARQQDAGGRCVGRHDPALERGRWETDRDDRVADDGAAVGGARHCLHG